MMGRLECILGEVDVSVLWIGADRSILQHDKTRVQRTGMMISVHSHAKVDMSDLAMIEVRQPGGALFMSKAIGRRVAVGDTIELRARLVEKLR